MNGNPGCPECDIDLTMPTFCLGTQPSLSVLMIQWHVNLFCFVLFILLTGASGIRSQLRTAVRVTTTRRCLLYTSSDLHGSRLSSTLSALVTVYPACASDGERWRGSVTVRGQTTRC
jgi:hypothetical protein